MAFAIMRCKKLKGMGSVAGAFKHCFRERETFNADPSRTSDNEHAKGTARTTDEAMGKLRALLPEKRRKDAVLAVEYMFTASPEWWGSASKDEQTDFFNRAHQWLAQKYGKDRIVVAAIHRDETSPHMSAFVVPLTQDGRLSAKEFIGDRKRMFQDQTDFAQRVASLGLERGIEGSKARHTTISAYYARVSAKTPKEPVIALPEPSMGELFNAKKYGERVAQSVVKQLRPHMHVLSAKALERDTAVHDKAVYQRMAKRAQLERDTAQAEADRKAQASIRSRELELDSLKELALDELMTEQQARLFEKQQAESAQRELQQQLERSREEVQRLDLQHRQYVASLLNSTPEKVVAHLDKLRESILSERQRQDRSNDLDR